MGTPAAIDIEEIEAGEDRILRLAGELDLTSAATLEAAVSRACSGSTRSITMDLSGLSFIDSTGLAVIVRTSGLCSNRGCAFQLVRGPRAVQRLFEVTGLDAVLPFVKQP
ncbi:MAG TPA: STAS domain-containing protein [Solirubrobacteraceae bacterium]